MLATTVDGSASVANIGAYRCGIYAAAVSGVKLISLDSFD